MIHVILKERDQKISSLKVTGHANFDEYGKDIVCAGVSAITFGGLNALTEFYDYPNDLFEVEVTNDLINITINDLKRYRMQLVLETIYIQLRTIKETYPDYIKIDIIGGVSHDV